ncbi:hypothetical protein ACI6Q5_05485 [Xanthomonas codiaei]|uniref:Uncharacterized protein n=1 Tax=Xanthomonas codiaei TaxID=56463 RepID=A0A2S7CGY5_9XANT|nr:hypothetical protein [Xanthomonas codiaei]PPU60781.1 hypothetical protein XcodCFBP4690_17015 [Xanthomonas codiaei]
MMIALKHLIASAREIVARLLDKEMILALNGALDAIDSYADEDNAIWFIALINMMISSVHSALAMEQEAKHIQSTNASAWSAHVTALRAFVELGNVLREQLAIDHSNRQASETLTGSSASDVPSPFNRKRKM